MKILAEKLKELREEHGLTLKSLASKIGVAFSAVHNWENEINEPKASYIIALSKFFNVSADELLGIENTIEIKQNINSKETNALLEDLKDLDEKDIAYIRGVIYAYKEKSKNRNIK